MTTVRDRKYFENFIASETKININGSHYLS